MYVNHVCAVSVEARKKVLASTLNLSHLSGNQLKIFSLYVST